MFNKKIPTFISVYFLKKLAIFEIYIQINNTVQIIIKQGLLTKHKQINGNTFEKIALILNDKYAPNFYKN